MKTITFKPEFEAKLKKLKVKRRFIRNLLADIEIQKVPIEARVQNLNKITSFWGFINAAFIHLHTSEGVDFWTNIAYS